MPTVTPQITVTGSAMDLFGDNEPGTLILQLCAFGSQFPRIPGTTVIAQTAPLPIAISAEGTYSFKLWGNDVITPSGTFYTVRVVDANGNTVQINRYQFTGTETVDLSSAVPYTPPPPLISSTGFADSIVPTGTIDGTNAVFTLPSAKTPNPRTSLNLYLNGVRLDEGTAYTLSAATITYQDGSIPQEGDTHIADWRFIQQSAQQGQAVQFADDIVPDGTIDGSNAVFTLPQAPNPATSLELFKNGIRMTEGLAYTLSGDTITYETAYIPQPGDPGDSHICNYRFF